jgi:hypothetical protein
MSALNRVQRRAAEFANHTNESGWETLAQRRMIAQSCTLYKVYTGRPAWKAIGDSLLKPYFLSSIMMALGWAQPVTEMSTMNLPVG